MFIEVELVGSEDNFRKLINASSIIQVDPVIASNLDKVNKNYRWTKAALELQAQGKSLTPYEEEKEDEDGNIIKIKRDPVKESMGSQSNDVQIGDAYLYVAIGNSNPSMYVKDYQSVYHQLMIYSDLLNKSKDAYDEMNEGDEWKNGY